MTPYNHFNRRLRRNASTALPRHIVAYDSETLPEQTDETGRRFAHRFRLGVAISARIKGVEPSSVKTHYIQFPQEFWQLLVGITRERQTTWVVGHNILFDLVVSGMAEQFALSNFIVEWPKQRKHKENNADDNDHCYSLCVIDSPPTIIRAKCTSTGGHVLFLDTLNYFQCPLRDLGEACGLRKYRMPDFRESDANWFKYCERDTEIVFDTFCTLLRWVKENDCGMFRYTAASQAMAAYRHRFMKHTIWFHDLPEVKAVERASYFGGRSEVFRLGEIDQTVHQYDCNALFPFVMSRGMFPVVLDRYELRSDYLELLPDIDCKYSVAEVELLTWDNAFPKRDERGVLYPIGRFRTTLAGDELENAYRRQFIVAMRSWAQYRCEPIFDQWVGELWGMRQCYKHEGNRLYEQFVKMLMNSLYGKFAQLSPQWVNVPDYLPMGPWSTWTECNATTGEMVQFRSFGWQTQRCDKRAEIPNTLVAISAFVTAAARCYMNTVRESIGAKHCYYQGVDGVIVTETGKHRLENAGLIDPDAIGKFKHQHTANSGVISGVSDYRLGDKVVIAGRAIRHHTSELAENLQRKFHVTEQLFGGCAANFVTERLSEWRKATGYWKGKVGADGWIVPVSLDCQKQDGT